MEGAARKNTGESKRSRGHATINHPTFESVIPTTWPALPDTLLPEHAYGLLQVRENGRLRDSLLARVNLATGVVTPETYLSRTAHDWGYDDITFRAYKSTLKPTRGGQRRRVRPHTRESMDENAGQGSAG